MSHKMIWIALRPKAMTNLLGKTTSKLLEDQARRYWAPSDMLLKYADPNRPGLKGMQPTESIVKTIEQQAKASYSIQHLAWADSQRMYCNQGFTTTSMTTNSAGPCAHKQCPSQHTDKCYLMLSTKN